MSAEITRIEEARALLDAEPKRNRLRLQSLEEFVQRPAISSHVAGAIPANSIVLVFGPPKGGKTFSVCDMTMHAAHGLDWHGLKVKRRVRVAYLLGEGISGCRVRLRAWLQQHDSIEEPGEFRILPQGLSLPDRILEVIEALQDFKPDIIVMDTLNAYFGAGNENSTEDMTAFCTAIRLLRDTLQASVVVIHHSGVLDQTRERGSIVMRGTADVIIQVARAENESGDIAFQVTDARDMERWESPIGLKLRQVEVDWLDDDGEPLRTCVVDAASGPVTLPGRGGRPLGGTQATIVEVALDLAKGKPREADGRVVLSRSDITKVATKDRGASRQSVSAAWRPLQSRGYFSLVEPGSLLIRPRS